MFTSSIYTSTNKNNNNTTTTNNNESTSSMIWTPIDCCMGASLTESGLLQRTSTEVELYTAISTYVNNGTTTAGSSSNDTNTKCTIEVRCSNVDTNTNNDDTSSSNTMMMMVPLTLDGNIDTTKTIQNFYHRTTFPFQIIITTHRIVFIRDRIITLTDNTNNTSQSNSNPIRKHREARYIHMSNVFSITTETFYFKSPKIILSTSIGELIFAFYKSNNTNHTNTNTMNNPMKVRDELYNHIMNSYQRKQWDIDDQHVIQKVQQRKMITNHKVGVDAILTASKQRHEHIQQITDRVFDTSNNTNNNTNDNNNHKNNNKNNKNNKNQAEINLEQFLQEATELVQVIHKYVATLDRSLISNNNNNNNNTSTDNDTEKLVNMLQDMGMTSILNKTNNHNNNNHKRKKNTNNNNDTTTITEDDIYYDTIARQIVDLIHPKLQNQTVPMMTLTDVYCIYNRSRGTQLISPQDLLYAIQRLDYLHLNLILFTFPKSNLKVIQDPSRTNIHTLTNTFLSMCQENEQEYYNYHNNNNNNNITTTTTNTTPKYYGYITALSVSQKCNIPTVLAFEQLQMVEQMNQNHNNDNNSNHPPLVRDETLEVIRFYPNLFFSF